MKNNKEWLSFEKAKSWAREQKLTSESHWRRIRKEGLPIGIPTNPNRTYSGQWKGWSDFLGNKSIYASDRSFVCYTDASEWAMRKGYKSLKHWRKACVNNEIPMNIPRSPWAYYKEWKSFPEFLKQNLRQAKNREWRSFLEAQKWIRDKKILRKEDWERLLKENAVPSDIPSNLHVIYNKEWKGWRNFVGLSIRGGSSLTEIVLEHELSHFVEVNKNIRKVLMSNGRKKGVDIILNNNKIIIEYDGSHWHKELLDKDTMETAFLKQAGWTTIRVREYPLQKISEHDVLVHSGWSLLRKTVIVLKKLLELDILPQQDSNKVNDYEKRGILFSASTDLKDVICWRSFEEGRKWAQEQKIASESHWRMFVKKGILPSDIPSQPQVVYAVLWKNWGDWLGTGNVYISPKSLVDYQVSHEYAKTFAVKEAREWQRHAKLKLLPPGIPSTPSKVYKRDWIGWPEFFGIRRESGKKRGWRSFKEAREWAKNSGADSDHAWRKLVKNHSFPSDIPKAPHVVYSIYWKGWGDWLGTENTVGGAARWRKVRGKNLI